MESRDFTQNFGSNFLNFNNVRFLWKSLPKNEYNNTGYIVDGNVNENIEVGPDANKEKARLIRENSKILFTNDNYEEKWVTVKEIKDKGIVNLEFMTLGRIELSDNVKDDWYIKQVIPGMRKIFNEEEKSNITSQMRDRKSFGLRYDFINDKWIIINEINIGSKDIRGEFDLIEPEDFNDIDNRWLLRFLFTNEQGKERYNIESRCLKFIFGSDKQVRFFFKNDDNIIDYETGELVEDHIKILQSNTDRNNVNQLSKKARAVVGHMYTKPSHSKDSEYDITNIIPFNSNYGNVKLYTALKEKIDNWSIRFENDKTILQINNPLLPNNQVTAFKITDVVDVFDFEDDDVRLKRSYDLSLNSYYVKDDGVVDYSKVMVQPVDSDNDGVPDYPLTFEDIVNINNYIFFSSYTDFDNIVYDRIDNNVMIINENTTRILPDTVYYCKENITIFDNEMNAINYEEGKFYKGVENSNQGLRFNKADELTNNTDENGVEYKAHIGRAFNDNDPFIFKWKHFAGDEERIDISVSNIIDMYILTRGYDNAVRSWLNNREGIETFPAVPTSNEIKNNIRFIENNKSTSDQIIYIPAEYRLLFGPQARPELQAKFKVIRAPGSNLTDNELKSKVIQSINEFFDIDNWDFGSGFYYTELSSYIHTQLVGNLSSVVIVPMLDSSRFGELFEIRSEPHELFLSTANVENVEIVKTYTDFNIRKR